MKQTKFLGLKIYEEDMDNVDPTAINENMETIDRKAKEIQGTIDFLYKPWDAEEVAPIAPKIGHLMEFDSLSLPGVGEVKTKSFTFKAKHYGEITIAYELITMYEKNAYDAKVILKCNGEIVATRNFPAIENNSASTTEKCSDVIEVSKGDVIELSIRVEGVGEKEIDKAAYRRISNATIYANGDTLFRYYADDWSY